ncbi:MAG TPA: DUF2911 domain-containing protein [Gemmatimonadales bacterium]|nr:DUF2911 domain-containing protein [Gemmatimonadales bacterium]
MRLPSGTSLMLVAVASAPLAAQAPADSGAFVVHLGTDTLAVERYTRTAGELRSDLVVRVPDARRVRYTATLDAGGAIRALDLTLEPLGRGHPTSQPAHGVMWFHGDTADVTLTLGDSTRRLRIPARRGAVPLAAYSHALIEQAVLQARRKGRDSVAFDWVGLGAPGASPSYVVRCAADSVRVAFFGAPGYIKLDELGRILSLDGRATTQKVWVERRTTLDLDHYAAEFTARQAVEGPLGPLSPRDTTRATIAGATLTVDYSRPRKRGRDIFGGVVGWHEIWRLGANSATHLTTDADLEVDGRIIPAGTYTLWMLPAPEGASLVVNRETGQWGTNYDPARDLARLGLRRERAPAPVDQLTIAVEAASAGGVLRISWDTTSYLVRFSVRRTGHAAGS